jgi:hypothetical protein
LCRFLGNVVFLLVPPCATSRALPPSAAKHPHVAQLTSFSVLSLPFTPCHLGPNLCGVWGWCVGGGGTERGGPPPLWVILRMILTINLNRASGPIGLKRASGLRRRVIAHNWPSLRARARARTRSSLERSRTVTPPTGSVTDGCTGTRSGTARGVTLHAATSAARPDDDRRLHGPAGPRSAERGRGNTNFHVSFNPFQNVSAVSGRFTSECRRSGGPAVRWTRPRAR